MVCGTRRAHAPAALEVDLWRRGGERVRNGDVSAEGGGGWRVKYSLIPSNIPGVHPGVVSRKRFFIATAC